MLAQQQSIILSSREGVFALAREFLLDWAVANEQRSQLVVQSVISLLLEIPAEELRTEFGEELYRLLASPVTNASTVLIPLITHIVTEDVIGELAVAFVSFVEKASFLDQEQEDFALNLIENQFKEPLLAVILLEPGSYLSQVRGMLASEKEKIQDLGVVLLGGLFPASVIVEDIAFTKWLILDGPERILSDVMQVLQECSEQASWDCTGLCIQIVEAFSHRKSHRRFAGIWSQLFNLFDAPLARIAQNDLPMISQWINNQEQIDPLSDLHFNLFRRLTDEQRQVFSTTVFRLLSLEDPNEFESCFSLLSGFTDLDGILEVLMVSSKRPRFLVFRLANLSRFVTLYETQVQSYLDVHSASVMDLVSKFISHHTNNQKLLEVIFSILAPSFVQTRPTLLQKMLLNPHMYSVKGYAEFIDGVYTGEFASQSALSFSSNDTIGVVKER